MKYSTRRAAGLLLGALTLEATALPTVALAVETRRAEARLVADGHEVVEIFTENGALEGRIEGTRLSSRISASGRALRSVERRKIDSLRAEIAKIQAKHSKNGTGLLKTTAMVLDALSATTDSAYRATMNKLPVKAVRQAATNSRGQAGTRISYFHRGRVRLSIFQLTAPVGGTQSAGSRPGEGKGGPSAAELPAWCQYNDPETSELIEGECATQQELDDAAATLIVIDADVATTSAAVHQAAEEECEEENEDYVLDEVLDCGPPPDESSPAPAALFGSSTLRIGSGNLSGLAPTDLSAVQRLGGPSNVTPEAIGAIRGCLSEKLGFISAYISYAGSAAGLSAMLFMISNPVGWAVALAAVATLAAGINVVSRGLAYQECVSNA